MPENIFNLKIFQGIEKNIIEEIILNSPEKIFKQGELIFIQNTDSNGEAYIIKSGKLKVSINGKQIAQLKNGDIVGEIALLNEEKRTATVEAIEDTEVIILNLDKLIQMISNGNTIINNTIIERIEENINS